MMFQLLFLLICAVIVIGGSYFALRTLLSGTESQPPLKRARQRLEEFFGAETD